ncbi:MAG: ATP-dependent RNA helicase RhlB [Pseudomonadota bacterium]
MSETHLSDTRFDALPLDGALKDSIAAAGFEYCTPIQAQALPLALEGQDIAGQAQTGTGKSAAFLVATFQHLIEKPPADDRPQNGVRALILAPTRELAIQIHKDAEQLSQHLDLKLGLAYGGANYERQRETIQAGVDVLIGTPGRLIDFWKQKVFSLKHCQVLVLDEADRMFDLGFIDDVRFLLRRCPPPGERLSLLFSATLSLRVQELAYEHMNNPQKVEVAAEQVTAERVEQRLYHPANEEKIPLLLGLFKKHQPERSIIFVNTKRNADTVWGYFKGNGIEAALLSGDVPQNKRTRMVEKFKNGELKALVATDVASRGLHIPDVSHVFNYDLPQSGEDYVHRIGRTGRAGASGWALSFACEDTAFNLMDIEEYIEGSIPTEPVSDDLLATPEPPVKPKRRGPPPGKSGNRRRGPPRRR